MKTILYLSLSLMLFSATAKAQDSYNTNAETAKELSAAMGNDDLLNVRYFYYPNLQAYFDRETSTYLYTRNGNDWIESSKLPNALRGYSLSNNKRIPLTDYTGDEPYELIKEHIQKYPANYTTKRLPKDKEPQTEGVAMQ
ncbi:hypothetical protein [Flavobacterium sp.]|uniref:hypothetical protein n=1 Tax=Flavobacterium sp. TaxID=239 RepID=UPI001223DCDC|nr:hypothetical protein [Flavobacterium sp.]RZJ71044.1 MAG: hypothetical protein EOO49_11355 [Flavobacterium sp.]